MANHVLAINGGSSSVKFALFKAEADDDKQPVREIVGAIKRIGLPDAVLSVRDAAGKSLEERALNISDQAQAAGVLIDWLRQHFGLDKIAAIGHRIVRGGRKYLDHGRITPEMMTEMRRVSDIDPDHMPGELALVNAFTAQCPSIPQMACFDTAFHRDLPQVAKLLPIPRKYIDRGVRRYGFHGLSYSYLMEELTRLAGPEAAQGRVILAHLGNGASMAAVREGKCVDTTMSFTPTAGLVMGTRCGDLDPGLLVYWVRHENLTADQFDDLVNRQSGLLGVSGISSDMQELLAKREGDSRAAEAIDLFCYQARKWIGAMAAALGGLDTLVFSGGIGENAAKVRSQICTGLEHLGIRIDATRNAAKDAVISTLGCPVTVRVIATDEEIMIARITRSLLKR
jgi:acetate kinase